MLPCAVLSLPITVSVFSHINPIFSIKQNDFEKKSNENKKTEDIIKQLVCGLRPLI